MMEINLVYAAAALIVLAGVSCFLGGAIFTIWLFKDEILNSYSDDEWADDEDDGDEEPKYITKVRSKYRS